MNIEKKDFASAKNCVVISNGIIQLVIAVEFGPRILFYGFEKGQNFFKVFENQIQNMDKKTWQIYGGHRLWLAPEQVPRSYYPDNFLVEYTWKNNTISLTAPIEKENGIQKIIEIELKENSSELSINHYIINHNVWEIELSAWALSVMNTGGRVVIPQEEYRPHPDYLAPARPVVLWHFTRMNDPRFVWGKKYIQMSQNNMYEEKIKIGILNKKGCAAYILNDEVFIKKHKYIKNAIYPDMGSNAEFFTMPEFLEVETLSPLTKILPGEKIEHREYWELKKMKVGPDEEDLDTIFI